MLSAFPQETSSYEDLQQQGQGQQQGDTRRQQQRQRQQPTAAEVPVLSDAPAGDGGIQVGSGIQELCSKCLADSS